MKEVYAAMNEWKEESIRQEKITEAIKELAKEGYAVYNGPKQWESSAIPMLKQHSGKNKDSDNLLL